MELNKALDRTQRFHQFFYNLILEERTALTKYSKEELVDQSLLLREMQTLIDDARKECERLRELMSKIICIRWTDEYANNPQAAEPIHGKIAIGTPQVRMMAGIPRPDRDPENYAKLMDWLGVTGQGVTLCRPHWPELIGKVTQLSEAGLPLPPGMGKAYPRYNVVLRRKKT